MADKNTRYRDLLAPGPEVFEALASEVMGNLPSHFKDWVENVIVRVEDFPDDDMMEELGLNSRYELLGLYHCADLMQADPLVEGEEDQIFLFRRAILDYWAENEDSLSAIIAHVLIHEIGQNFNLSEEEGRQIEEQATRTGGRALH